MFPVVAPLIANISSEGTVAEVGERFELMCSVLGGPNNMFQWLQNDNTLQGENMDTLILDNVTVQDAGVYTCRVVNAAGENTSQIEIFVAPNIVTPPQDVLAEDGDEDVRFTCIAEGVPTPSITWDFSSDGSFTDMMSSGSGTSSTSSFTSSGSAMSSGSLLPYEITTSSNATTVVSILTISTVTFSDYGYYRCVVYSSSLMLTESATAILHGNCRPSI